MGDDAPREKLRSVDGVPAVSYQVQGEKVFVFEKLVHLVKQNGHMLSRSLRMVSTGAAMSCVNRAFLSQEVVSALSGCATILMVRKMKNCFKNFIAMIVGVINAVMACDRGSYGSKMRLSVHF